MRARIGWLVVLVWCGCGVTEERTAPFVHVAREELRPTDTSSGLMWRFQSTDVVEKFGVDGGAFLVHFTRAGLNSVPAADSNDSGVPDFVEVVASSYEEVGALYHGPLGYRRPVSDGTISNNGGDARFDVYLIDFARAADGAFRVDQCPTSSPSKCIGYIVQENDYAGYGYPNTTVANRILASHEYFHAVQAAYDDDQNAVISEGSAVWATERFDSSTSDLENFVHGYLERPDRSIDSPPPGPVPTFAYGSGLFFTFLTERKDDALVRKLWERLENGQGAASEPADQANPTFVVQLDALLKADYSSSFAAEFAEFAKWNLYTAGAADPAQAYRDGQRYPEVTSTTVPLPYWIDGQRVFYASAQYFVAPANGRTLVTAAVTNSALTNQDDREGLVVWLAARKSGRNAEVVKVTNGETVDVTGGSVIVVVSNTNRGPIGASLSQRPGICIGTPAEVAECVAGLTGVPVDAGVPDAGAMPEPDAGMTVDAGTGELPPPAGCGCGMGTVPALFLAIVALGRKRPLGGKRA